jgi:signal transduction histidine kinase
MDPEQARLPPEARRLATVVGMARPVQHDINNLLTVVFANLELLKRTAAEGGPQRQLDRIQAATRRLELSTRALLTMLRRPIGQLVVLRLSEAIEAIQPLLGLLLPAAGALTIDLPPDDAPVRLDRAALEEALLAVAQDAAEVLPRGAGLTLAVANRPGAVELSIGWPQGLELPGLATLAAMAQAAGGSAETGAASLHLRLPAEATPG